MRHISFSLTTRQVYAGTKDVTRRLGWRGLKPGTQLCAVEKGMGLKAGEKVVPIRAIRVVSVRRERLDRLITDKYYGRREVRREGFQRMTAHGFVTMFCTSHKCRSSTVVTRIEFEYADDATTLIDAAVALESEAEARRLLCQIAPSVFRGGPRTATMHKYLDLARDLRRMAG